jgi:cephalosporin hydroxylase
MMTIPAREGGVSLEDVYGTSFTHVAEAPVLSDADRALIADFTRLYYRHWHHDHPGGRGSVSIGWLGHLAQKCPTDIWTCQEIIAETRPDLIIETGSCLGGSGVFMATLCELLGHGEVISIDIEAREDRPRHPRLRFLHGDSAAPDLVASVAACIRPDMRVMVILDSDHRAPHVAAELAAWADFVTPGCYLIVEDTVVNGHPLLPEYGPGAMEALDDFLCQRHDFVVDRSRERFLLTMNPRGYLRRLAS